jgi:hypothetical protein
MEGDQKMKHKIIDLVKGTTAKLSYCKGGKLFYTIDVDDTRYTFPIDVTDKNEIGDATFELEDKAMIFMRYINKAIKALDKGEDPESMIRWESI